MNHLRISIPAASGASTLPARPLRRPAAEMSLAQWIRGFALCLVSVAGFALVGCDEVAPDTAPAFTRPAPDQTYTVGEAIRPLVLPEAVGGNGALSYELSPGVPGLTFDPAARTLSGTPSTADTHQMTYRVSDADGNTADSDADTLTFTVAVRVGDTAPRFDGRVADQSYTVGEAIGSLVLPVALGGNGPLTYELRPAIPGLTFDPAARTLERHAQHGRHPPDDLSGVGRGRKHGRQRRRHPYLHRRGPGGRHGAEVRRARSRSELHGRRGDRPARPAGGARRQRTPHL